MTTNSAKTRNMKARLTEELFVNWWLEKYHDTNLDKVLENHPEWQDDPPSHSREFYAAYTVTDEQHDEWYAWAIQKVMKHYRYGKKRAERDFCLPYLDVSPMVSKNQQK